MEYSLFFTGAAGAFIGLVAYLRRIAGRRALLIQPGWGAIQVGIGMLLLGVVIRLGVFTRLLLAREIRSLEDWISLVEGVCYLGGAACLVFGLARWCTTVTSLEQVERFSQELTGAYARLEMHNQELRAKGEQFRAISHSAQDAIIAADSSGIINFWNSGAQSMFGYLEGEVVGQPVEILMPERYRLAHHQGMRRVRATGEPTLMGRILELEGRRKDGREIPMEMTLASWTSNGQPFFVGVIRDITTRRESERGNQRLHQSRVAISALLQIALEPISLEEQLQQSLEIILAVPWLSIQSKGSIFLLDQETGELVLTVQKGLAAPLLTQCARISQGYCLCGRAAKERAIVYAEHLDHRHDVTYPGIRDHGHYCVPILSQDRLLGVVNMYLPEGHPEDQEETEFLRALGNTLAGVIERKRIEKHLEHLAHHDTLTGLPNRKLFHERLGQEIARSGREKSLLAVMFLDLDRFKVVNDTMGHEVGDKLLIDVARRLKGCLREEDTVARLGGDEFAVVLPNLKGPELAGVVARKIIARLVEPFHLYEHVCHIGTSIGIAYYPEHGTDPEDLLRRADTAMYAVKEGGRNNYLCYIAGMEPPRSRREGSSPKTNVAVV
ncbi:MAG: diguanylate cyclase [Magnetococcales bacterium]|nr:diguanylate cyclase [Magnetococcales bacterium]